MRAGGGQGRGAPKAPLEAPAQGFLSGWEPTLVTEMGAEHLVMNHSPQRRVSESHLSLLRKRRRWVGSGERGKYNQVSKGKAVEAGAG